MKVNKISMRKPIGNFSVFIFILALVSFMPADKAKVNWMSLKEVEEAKQQQAKPILIDLYTDWCGWCKVMDRKTYADKKVVAYLQEKYYAVKVNAETKNPISWGGKSFSFNASYRTNEFALYLTQGRLSYPTTVIIPSDGSAPQAIPGYLSPKEIEIILKYFGDSNYGKQSFETFQKGFKSTW